MAKRIPAQTREQELITLTREEATESRRVRRLKRQLKSAKADLALVRRQRKALQRVMEGEREQSAPNRLTSGATGFTLHKHRTAEETIQDRRDYLASHPEFANAAAKFVEDL